VTVRFASSSDVSDLLHDFLTHEGSLVISLVLDNLEGFKVSVLDKTFLAHAQHSGRQEDSSYSQDVSSSGDSSQMILGDNLHGSGNVTDRDLVTWLLNLDFLVRDELG
jgi:hypothetical protein